MKKILMTLALVASFQFAYAQTGANKVVAQKRNAAKAAVESAEADAANAKKAAKLATWLNLGKAYLDANAAPTANAYLGATKTELSLLMGGNLNPISSETVVLDGVQLSKEDYGGCDFYFNENGTLVMTDVTEPVVPDALNKAFEAFKKAQELDVKGSKKKDISAAIKSIADAFSEQAYNQYTFGNFAAASKFFERVSEVSLAEPYAVLDTNSIYNAAYTAFQSENFAKAKELFEKCASYGYYYNDGIVFSYLSKLAEKDGDAEKSLAILKEGFAAFPQSQAILVDLINYYITSKSDTDELFSLLNKAKQNEPNNASLYYVEGNINAQLGNEEAAIAAWEKCSEVNPKYALGFYGEGVHFYDRAVDIQDAAAAELDDAKYMALVAEFEEVLEKSIAPFEKAFEIAEEADVKTSAAEYLRNATFRLRAKDPKFQAAYDKYNAYVQGEK